MDDLAHEWTDEQIEALAKRMHEVYQQASDEMADKLKSWMEDYDRKNKAWKDEVKAGTRTKAEYAEWLKRRASERSWYQSMIDTLSQDAVRSDILCRQMINDEIPTVMAECANIEGFEIDRAIRLDTSFTLYNHDSIRFALKDPILYPQLDIPKDLAWNQQKFASAITQSILQGESIPNTAKRLDSVFKMGEVSSVRAARTAMTYAESTGRLASMRRAEALGVPLMKVWRANLDERTRQAHREADGQTVGLDEKFIVGGYEMEGPGDPTAPGALVYNCRCRPLREIGYKDIPPRVTMRYNRLPKGMTYEDWKAGKKPDKPTVKKKQGIKQTVKPPAKKKPIDISKIKTKGQWVPK